MITYNVNWVQFKTGVKFLLKCNAGYVCGAGCVFVVLATSLWCWLCLCGAGCVFVVLATSLPYKYIKVFSAGNFI